MNLSVFLALMVHASATSKLICVCGFLYHFSQHIIVLFIQPKTLLTFVCCSTDFNIQILCHVPKQLVIKLPAVVGENKSWRSKIHYLVAIMMSKLSLIGILTPTFYLVLWSISCGTLLPLISFMFMAIVLL